MLAVTFRAKRLGERQPSGAFRKVCHKRSGRWARHAGVSNSSSEGVLEVWQDDSKVLDSHCQTLPTAATIYDRLQTGITAHSSHQNAVTLHVDDVELSNRPLW